MSNSFVIKFGNYSYSPYTQNKSVYDLNQLMKFNKNVSVFQTRPKPVKKQKPTYNSAIQAGQNRLNKISSKYNIATNQTKSQTLKDAQALSKRFINTYGTLASSSREELILEPYNIQQSKETENKINKVRAVRGNDTKTKANETSKLVKKYKAANCGECALILNKMGCDAFGKKYKIETINYYATLSDRGVSHVAMMISNGKEEYVIDPWVNPKEGGVYTKNDWIKMTEEVFHIKPNDQKNIFTNGSIQEKLTNKK